MVKKEELLFSAVAVFIAIVLILFAIISFREQEIKKQKNKVQKLQYEIVLRQMEQCTQEEVK